MLSRGQPSSLPIVDVFKIVLRRLCFEATPQILPDYGVTLGDRCSNTNFTRMSTLQKGAVKTIAKLQWRESSRTEVSNNGRYPAPILFLKHISFFFVKIRSHKK